MQPSQLRHFLSLTSVFLLLSAFFSWIAPHRFVAMDEGFYLLAAKLVGEGKVLYRDFFYPQTPLYPYLFAGWMKLSGCSWEAARILPALASALIGVLIFARLCREGIGAALFGLALFVFSASSIGWFTTTKSYAIPALFLFISYLLFERRQLLWVGLMIGLAANCRLYLGAALFVPLMLVFFENRLPTSKQINAALKLIIGCGITFLPHLYYIIVDFSSYWFSNIGYHLSRSSPEVEASMLSKWQILGSLIGYQIEDSADGIQLPLLFWISVGYIGLTLLKQRRLDPAAWIVLVLGVVNFIPTPSFVQYFCVLVPFLCVTTGLFYARALESLVGVGRIAFFICAMLVVAAYGDVGWIKLQAYTVTGEGVPGVRGSTNSNEARLDTIAEVSRSIDSITSPGALVVSQWPGYLLASHAEPYPGMENHFWVRVGPKLSPEDRKRFKIVSFQEVGAALTDSRVEAVVIDSRKEKRYFGEGALKRNKFTQAQTQGNITIYRRPAS